MERLNGLIEEFKSQIKIDLSDKEESFSQCKKVSILFIQYLEKNGIEAELIKVSSFLKGGFEKSHSKWVVIERNFWSHYMVRIKDTYIDLTWNQFIPGSPVPVIFSEEEVMDHWENFYVF